MDQVNKVVNQIDKTKNVSKSMQDLTDRINKIEEKTKAIKSLPKNFQELSDKVGKLEKEFEGINKETYYNREQIEEKIKVQEEIIMDMIKKFNDEFFKYKSEVSEELDSLKTQQDVLKISYAVNEKKLLDKIKTLIARELKKSLKGQEAEILMKIWIDELKEISNDFEKFKQLKPKEFNLKLSEILNTVAQFKQKIQSYE